jgi:hypothetical protein
VTMAAKRLVSEKESGVVPTPGHVHANRIAVGVYLVGRLSEMACGVCGAQMDMPTPGACRGRGDYDTGEMGIFGWMDEAGRMWWLLVKDEVHNM